MNNNLCSISTGFVLIGAGTSLWFVLKAGGGNNSILLVTLFTGWVLSPFLALLVSGRITQNWPETAVANWDWIKIVLPVAAIMGYTGVFTPADAKPAFIYLAVPFFSWLALFLSAILLPRISKRR
ncbi:MAG TPA: hypothetical protein VFW78_05055 [Bacteroidia bacterium]|nr:hypothetical protein [Bacteroidia bacterium]